MEKLWEDFWTSGKVEDYLTYCSCVKNDDREQTSRQEEKSEKQSKGGSYGTSGGSNRNCIK